MKSAQKPSASSDPQLTIILVGYNSWQWIEQCLRSFQHLSGWSANSKKIDFKTILVDNNSSDGTVQQVQQLFPWVEVVELKTNTGFAGGNNVALQNVKTPYAMLLNTDTEFLPDTDLSVLLQNFERDAQIGVVTPKVILSTGDIDHACHRGFPTPWNAFCYFSGLARLFPRWRLVAGYTQSWKNQDSAHEVEACTGAAMLVRMTAVEEVGLLDEAYFMYAEDIDWCYRFFQKGWKTWYDPSVQVIHHKHKSGLGGSSATVAWETRVRTTAAFYDTMKQFFRKFYSDRYPGIVLWLVFVMIDILKRRKIAQERKKYVQS